MAIASPVPITSQHQHLSLLTNSKNNNNNNFQHQDQHLELEAFNLTSAPEQNTAALSWSSQVQSLSVPRSAQRSNLTFLPPANIGEVPLALNQVPELMGGFDTTTSQTQQQFSALQAPGDLPGHQRDSSLSTLGSAGPASPYTQTNSNPHIAITDSASDAFPDIAFNDGVLYNSKQSMSQDSFLSQYPSSLSHARLSQVPSLCRRDKSTLLPPPDFQYSASSNPVSGASSIAGDSPATPFMDDHQHPISKRQKRGKDNHTPQATDSVRHTPLCSSSTLYHLLTGPSPNLVYDVAFNLSVSKFDSTMADVYEDELRNSNFTLRNTVSPSTPTSTVSKNGEVLSQRIHAANNQHLSTAQSPTLSISRDRSPFRHGSPMTSMSNDFNHGRMQAASHPEMTFEATQQFAQRLKAARNSAAVLTRPQVVASHGESSQATTISPRESMLELTEHGNTADFPLFQTRENAHHFMSLGDASATQASQSFGPLPVTSSHDASLTGFIPTSVAGNYSFVSRTLDSASIPHLATDTRQVQQQLQQDLQPRNLKTQQLQGQSPTSLQKPLPSRTDRGTFSCTYHGCPLRFETASLLQKHKREGHRQTHGLGVSRRDTSQVPGPISIQTQNGPHKCTQINPSTGKPCNTEFSRPYDLTRHEDTIHNPKKRKVSCPVCTDTKQFSRGDALSRHYRVCHPDLTPPGKRRGGAGRGDPSPVDYDQMVNTWRWPDWCADIARLPVNPS